jgi:two-component system response regulator WspF
MRIGIVNDLSLAVETLKRVISAEKEFEIAWIAYNGREAVDCAIKDRPDLILMDLIMPIMDGIQATEEIMRKAPCAILVVTASVGANSSKVFEAMGHGALDAAATPVFDFSGNVTGADELITKIKSLNRLIQGKNYFKPIVSKKNAKMHCPLVAIGSSTGGPKALATILSVLPKDFEPAIVIIQHVDQRFAEELAVWLDKQTQLPVLLAKQGSTPISSHIYLAGTNDHLVFDKGCRFTYTSEPKDYPYRPSVDSFFLSLVDNWVAKDTAILLTGMGKDGAEGLLRLREAGWNTIAQDEASSIVYGMPKTAAELNAAKKILNPENIANELIQLYVKKKEFK